MRAGPKAVVGLGRPVSLRPHAPPTGEGVIRTNTIMRDTRVMRDQIRMTDNG